MSKRHVLTRVAVGLVLFVSVFGFVNFVSHATTSGPSSVYAGAPGQNDCRSCHGDYPMNSGTATFGITAPLSYAPGMAQTVSVAFGNMSTVRHGFHITARDGAGAVAGTWTATSASTKSISSNAAHSHNSTGSGLSSWSMSWNAPATLPNGPVTFYACGAACDDDGSENGDRVYTAVRKMYKANLSAPAVWPRGSTQFLSLSAPGHGGELYFIVPSNDPTPVALGGSMVLEVTPNEIFFSWIQAMPQVFTNMTGMLDAAGSATAMIVVPSSPALTGLPFHFAAATATPALVATEVSNRVSITFQ